VIPRVYSDLTLEEGAAVPLDDEQHHYLRNVLRRVEGDEARLFNARDGEFAAVIEVLTKKAAIVRLKARTCAPAVESDLWLLIAPVKRAPLDLIVQKATELGVSAVLPVVTERTNAGRVKEGRLHAIAREAAEQSGRLSIPQVHQAKSLAETLDVWPSGRRLLFCDEAGDDPQAEWGGEEGRAPPVLSALENQKPGPWAVLIGPEGGFSPTERTLLRALPFVVPATLGPRILRADTASIAALTLLQAAVGDLRAH
jgi:16S rRNA (uracil1498-N3)-methyltransferase